MKGQVWLNTMVALLLLAGTASAVLPGYRTGSQGNQGQNQNDDQNQNDNQNHNNDQNQNKGGVCANIPGDCKYQDCRCEDYDQTCTSCREFPCPRGNQKVMPKVVCRPCCVDKYGATHCEDAPNEDDDECVVSPSHY